MKTIRLYIKRSLWLYDEIKKAHVLVAMLVMVLVLLPMLMPDPEETVRYLLKQTIPLVLIALIVYLALLQLAFWLLQRFCDLFGLPDLEEMVLGFREFEVWVQLGFYFGGFVLLLVTGVGVLVAVL